MILQSAIPHDLSPRALPGVQPLAMADWLQVDDAYAAQMAERQRLLADRRAEVLQLAPDARPAAGELLALVLEQLAARADFQVMQGQVTCPDGRVVAPNPVHPLDSLCALVQEDFCLLEKRGNEHALTGALLCFPASWTLAEKFLRPLKAIHAPVADYDANIARRVQRLFDGVRVGRPLWRFNLLRYADPALHQPRSEQAPRPAVSKAGARYLRSERQSILRLPGTGAVVFSIHTYVVAV